MREPFYEKVRTSDFAQREDYWYGEATARPVGFERNGQVAVVMVPVSEYTALCRLRARALHMEPLSDVLSQLTGAEQTYSSRSPQTYETDTTTSDRDTAEATPSRNG